MAEFTDNRDEKTTDELWLLEHPPVFTQGQAGKEEHLLMPGDIPVIQVGRGGQVTYHGPGQLVGYPLVNIREVEGVRSQAISSYLNHAESFLKYFLEVSPKSHHLSH